ncbi:MAG: A-macroglobulin complement component, partial [Candidatus Aminicenantes bacterium]
MKLQKLIQNVGQTVMIFLLIVLLTGMTNNIKDKKTHRTTSADLGGPVRYLAFVSTDKPIYRIKEKVYIRSVILNAADHTPWNGNTNAFFQVKGPKGNIVASGYAGTQDSVSGFAWSIPGSQAGGEYTVKVHYPQLGIPPALRKFDIRAFRAPRLKSQIEFLRKGYGPGDIVDAALEVSRAEGGIPGNAKVTITARVDGKEIHRSDSVVNRKGHCFAHFSLPKKIERGEGTLIFAINDGGVIENAAKTIPILLQTVDLSIYPEGGDLVASVRNRVYIEAKTPAQKPADISGIVVDSTGRQVGSFRTEHEGRGRFSFKPRKGQTYSLKITRPSGIKKTFPLPPVKSKGVLVQAVKDIYKKDDPIKLRVLSTIPGPLTVTLSKREKEIASLKIKGNKKADRLSINRVTLTPPSTAAGILIATVWDARGNPAAERLIYREPSQSVNIEISSNKEQYTPGEKVKLTVKTTDHNNEPISAVVGLTVTDDSVLEMIEKREQAPRLPVMVLLENDVKELADAHVYLDPKNPGAPLALDLLLGTQGWRKFAFIDTAKFLEKYGDDARRVLAMKVVTRFEDKKMRREVFRDRRRQNEIVLEGLEQDKIQLGAIKGLEAPASAKDLHQALEKAQMKQDKFGIIAEEIGVDFSSRASIVSAVVRVYAHKNRPNRKPGDRIDFTETLYWHAGIKTDGKIGQADVSFDLNDSVTGFRVLSDAFTKSGALGSHSKIIESGQPFYIEPKLPLEVTSGDRIFLPIGIVNGTGGKLKEISINTSAAKGIEISSLQPFSIAKNRRIRKILDLSIGKVTGNTDFILDASAGTHRDRVTRKLNIVSRGFPVEIAHSGLLKPDSSLEFTIEIPDTVIPGSAASNISVYPTPLANLTGALERLIREPYGCFEQTSSTTYPLVMAQQYFLTHQGVDPKLIQRSKEMLERG